MKEYVGGFEIPVKYIFCIEFFECASKLNKYFESFCFCEFSFVFDVLGQGSSIAKLVDKIVIIGSSEHLYELDDVDVINFAENGNLIICELA